MSVIRKRKFQNIIFPFVNSPQNRVENKIKYLDSQAKQLTRKERTHRLCTRGAMLEKYLGCPENLTDEQVETILKVAFHAEAAGKAIEHFKESNENTTL